MDSEPMQEYMFANRLIWIFILLIAAAGIISCSKDNPASPEPPEEEEPFIPKDHSIGIRSNGSGAEFYNKDTGESFIPRGVNYFYIVPVPEGHLEDRFFGTDQFDESRVRSDFLALAEKGYNVVRIFLDTCSSGVGCVGFPDEDGLNPPWLDNIKTTMDLAKEAGIYLLLTSNDLPSQGGYVQIADEANSELFGPYRNVQFLSPKGIEAFQKYWGDLMKGLAERDAAFDAVFAWSLLNEQWYFRTEPPFSLNSGMVTTANGSTYNMASQSDKKRMAVEGMIHFIDSIREVIDGYDPDALVTMGFFEPDYPNPLRQGDFRYVEAGPLLHEADLDFFDFHGYPGETQLSEIAENFGMNGYSQKPVIMGEYGAFLDRYPELDSAIEAVQGWVAQSCKEGYDGWLYWGMYRAPVAIGDATWGFMDDDQQVMESLSPLNQPDPCDSSFLPPENIALGKSAAVSQSLAEGPPSNALDGNKDTSWQSGGEAPQWIEIDLGELFTIEEIKLYVDQAPAGNTTHRVLGKTNESDDYNELHEFSGHTDFGDVLGHEFESPVESIRYLRIETTESPSWISWSEIEAFGYSE